MMMTSDKRTLLENSLALRVVRTNVSDKFAGKMMMMRAQCEVKGKIQLVSAFCPNKFANL